MEATVSQKEHRYVDKRPSLRGNEYTPPTRSKARQRCCHGLFFLVILLTLIVSIVSLILSLTANAGDNGSKIFTACVLFAGQHESPLEAKDGLWACDFIFAAKMLVILLTLVLVIVYLIHVCRGSNIFSACRITDTIFYLVLAVLSFSGGIIIDAGLAITCSQTDHLECHLSSWFTARNTLRAAEYSSYAVGVVFLALSVTNLVLSVFYCYYANKEREEAAAYLLAASPVSYASLRRKESNPFTNDAHV